MPMAMGSGVVNFTTGYWRSAARSYTRRLRLGGLALPQGSMSARLRHPTPTEPAIVDTIMETHPGQAPRREGPTSRPRRRSVLPAILCLLLGLGAIRAGHSGESTNQPALAETADLGHRVSVLKSQGKYTEALPLAQRALKISEEAFGPEHPDTARSLNNLAGLYESLAEYAKAEPLYRRALKIREKTLGPEHPDTAASLNNLAGLYRSLADYAQAEPLFQRALKIWEKVLGPEHPHTATSLNNLALLYHLTGDYPQAEPLYQRALKIREKVLGPEDPDTAMSLNNLAGLYDSMGDYAQAEPLYRRALQIKEKVLGPEHRSTATSLNNLADLYIAMADYAKAEPLCQRALKIREKVLGTEHPDTAMSLNNLAGLYDSMGDYAQAEPLHQRALKIREKVLGPEHPDVAMSLSNLAVLYDLMADYAQAEPLYRRALQIKEKMLGPEHPDTALSLNNLGAMYSSMGDYAQAKPLYQRALTIHEKVFGPEHPETATSLNNLAGLYDSMGDYAQAEPLYMRALKTREKVLGPEHPDTAASLSNLAFLYDALGDHAKAELLLRRAVDIQARNLDLTATVQSERQQLAMMRASPGYLHGWLSVAPQAGVKAEAMAPRVILGKGQVAARQVSLRRLRTALENANDQTALGLFSAWESASRQLARLTTTSAEPGPENDQRLKRLDELTEQKEKLERDLAARSAAYREAERRVDPTLADVRQALAARPDTALLDLIEYTHCSPPASGKGKLEREVRVLAFVLRSDSEIVHRIEFGAAQPIEEAVTGWRAALQAGISVAAAGQRLRELVWLKLEPALAGAKTVLVSPDGVLSQIPWGALPGSDPNRFLVEEYAFGVVPVPRLLPEMLAPGEGRTNATPSLLVVGEVDYGGDPGVMVAAVSRSAAQTIGMRDLRPWEELRSTRDEVLAVADSFRQRFEGRAVKELRRQQATEAAFRDSAGSHRYLHLATHGFFAEGARRRQLASLSGREATGRERMEGGPAAGWPPGLLSGLVLAGANRPVEEGKDDGVLTALEVQALDLRGVELAVLSACETALGESVRGEGVLGLQRAFQLAGACTTVGSLWRVPDEATRALMSEFYRQLWEEQKSKLDALRAAQLWMMREGRTRGVNPGETDASASAVTLPPKYWAAFVLSGDWR